MHFLNKFSNSSHHYKTQHKIGLIVERILIAVIKVFSVKELASMNENVARTKRNRIRKDVQRALWWHTGPWMYCVNNLI